MIKSFAKEYNIVYINCLKTAIELGFNIFKEDIGEGVIRFKVPMSIWSWGEKFEIRITKSNKTSTEVELASTANVGLQIIDWGKNDKNVCSFFETLNKRLNK